MRQQRAIGWSSWLPYRCSELQEKNVKVPNTGESDGSDQVDQEWSTEKRQTDEGVAGLLRKSSVNDNRRAMPNGVASMTQRSFIALDPERARDTRLAKRLVEVRYLKVPNQAIS